MAQANLPRNRMYLSVLTYLRKSIPVTKSQQELEDLDDDSTEIFKSNIVERYGIRPDSVSSIDKLCLPEFAAYYFQDCKKRL